MVIFIKDAQPGLAAVFGAIDAAGFVGSIRVAEGGDIDDVGVGRMDADAGDGLGIVEAEVLPFLTAIDGPIDSVTLHDVAAELSFAHADVDDVGV